MNPVNTNLVRAIQAWINQMWLPCDDDARLHLIEEFVRFVIAAGGLGAFARLIALYAHDPQIVKVGDALIKYDATHRDDDCEASRIIHAAMLEEIPPEDQPTVPWKFVGQEHWPINPNGKEKL